MRTTKQDETEKQYVALDATITMTFTAEPSSSLEKQLKKVAALGQRFCRAYEKK